MTSIAVVPGSFDPLTLGHLDVIRRAATVFDQVHVVVVHNPDKTAMIDADVRAELIRKSLTAHDVAGNLVVTVWSEGLLVDYCRRVGASVLVKGVRSQIDVAYETPMVLMNRSLAGVETVFFLPDPAYSLVSSSLVRQVHALGGDVAAYVPQPVLEYLQAKLLD